MNTTVKGCLLYKTAMPHSYPLIRLPTQGLAQNHINQHTRMDGKKHS